MHTKPLVLFCGALLSAVLLPLPSGAQIVDVQASRGNITVRDHDPSQVSVALDRPVGSNVTVTVTITRKNSSATGVLNATLRQFVPGSGWSQARPVMVPPPSTPNPQPSVPTTLAPFPLANTSAIVVEYTGRLGPTSDQKILYLPVVLDCNEQDPYRQQFTIEKQQLETQRQQLKIQEQQLREARRLRLLIQSEARKKHRPKRM